MSLPTPVEYTYQEIEGRQVLLDILPPPNYTPATKQYKTLIFYHGGGLVGGSRKFLANNLHLFTEKNWLILSVDYHLLPESGVREIHNDVLALEAWLLKNQAEIGADLKKLAIAGASAGAFVGVEACNTWTVIRPIAFLDLYGMVNTSDDCYTTPKPPGTKLGPIPLDVLDAKDYAKYFEAGRTPVTADFSLFTDLKSRVGLIFWALKEGKLKDMLTTESGGVYSPLDFVTANFPPTMAVHGDVDTVVPIKDSLVFLEILRKFGVENELVTVVGAEHGLNPAENTIEYVRKGLEFVEKHL